MNVTLKKRVSLPGHVVAPPVFHGLLGNHCLKQHMFVDNNWSLDDLMEEFTIMRKFLKHFLEMQNVDKRHKVIRTATCIRNLKLQCRQGRQTLKAHKHFGQQEIHTLLDKYKNLQRLFWKMPIHNVNESMDHHTFCMRKERDRLHYRMIQLKQQLEKLMRCSICMRTLIINHSEQEIAEDSKIREICKKIEKNKISVLAAQTINLTYKKIIRILRHDAVFYERILVSLNADIKEQQTFIHNILQLATPAFNLHSELLSDYKHRRDGLQKFLRESIQHINKLSKAARRESKYNNDKAKTTSDQNAELLHRYVRKTPFLKNLEKQLFEVENVIKNVKTATYCANALDIFPSIRYQIDASFKFKKQTECSNMHNNVLNLKQGMCSVLRDILRYNVHTSHYRFAEVIKILNGRIEHADKQYAQTLQDINKVNQAFVLFRFSLWHMYDTLRSVEGPKLLATVTYPNLYLKMPLLHFDGHDVVAYPPTPFSDNLAKVLAIILKKVNILLKSYPRVVKLTKNSIQTMRNDYIMDSALTNEHDAEEEYFSNNLNRRLRETNEDEDDEMISKYSGITPNRAQIKALSQKIVEEYSRKLD